MNKIVMALALVVMSGYAIPNLSCAHQHILGPPETERLSLSPAARTELSKPVPIGENLSQRAEQASWSWDWVSLTHPDSPYLSGKELHNPGSYRSFQAPDGAALLFSWPFGGLGNQAAAGNTNLERNGGIGNDY